MILGRQKNRRTPTLDPFTKTGISNYLSKFLELSQWGTTNQVKDGSKVFTIYTDRFFKIEYIMKKMRWVFTYPSILKFKWGSVII